MPHIPVLLNEVIEALDPKPGENFIDCTVGMGGHATAILERTSPNGRVLGIDWDAESLQQAELRITPSTSLGTGNYELRKRIILVNDNFANITQIVRGKGFGPVHGVLMDLGFSSWHLEESGRGFSFQREEPLDMRFTQGSDSPTAAVLLNTLPEGELERIVRTYGEERFARQITREIVSQRRREKLTKTTELVYAVRKAIPGCFQHSRIHPATRTFQALRIAVNSEIENLEKGLRGALSLLAPGGRLAVISFHSLEDRTVKKFMREHVKTGELQLRTKKPVIPSVDEIRNNLRARSAKLRAALKLPNP